MAKCGYLPVLFSIVSLFAAPLNCLDVDESEFFMEDRVGDVDVDTLLGSSSATMKQPALPFDDETINMAMNGFSAFAFNKTDMFPSSSNGSLPTWVKKMTFMVNMTDNTKLKTNVYLPSSAAGKSFSSVLVRTPYPSALIDCIRYLQWGHSCVEQFFRGRSGSEGEFDFWRFAATDSNDTIRWIGEQPWNNGTVWASGASADGIAAYLEPLGKPPGSFRGQFVMVASANVQNNAFQGGAFRTALIKGWLSVIGESSGISVAVNAETDPPFWNPVHGEPGFPNVDFPGVHLSGAFDVFSDTNVAAWRGYRANTDKDQYFIWLPSGHCFLTPIKWPKYKDGIDVALALTRKVFNGEIEAGRRDISTNGDSNDVFAGSDDGAMSSIRDSRDLGTKNRVAIYVMGPGTEGSIGNYWTAGADWPRYESGTDFFLGNNGSLAKTASAPGSKSYLYNPLFPVKTIGGNNLLIPCGPRDQRKLGTRKDILRFASGTLDDNVAVVGMVNITLFVSSSAIDTDFTAKLVDVFPDHSYEALVGDGIVRMRWRNGMTKTPQLLTPGKTEKITISFHTSWIFNKGHTIRLDVSSSNFPRFSINRNNGKTIAQGGFPVIAKNTVLWGGDSASVLSLPIVDMKTIEPVDDLAAAFGVEV